MNGADEVERTEALRDLVMQRRPVPAAVEALARFGWDYDDELVTVTSTDVARILGGYLEGRLPPEQVTAWAQAIEMRDDLGLESRNEETLKQVIFEMATPELFEALSPAGARDWLGRLDEQ
jgi:hypothetical protein